MYVCVVFVIGHYAVDLAVNKINTWNELKYVTQVQTVGKINLRNVCYYYEDSVYV
jgi:hypothetical protein